MTRLLALRSHIGTVRLMALQFLSLAGVGVAWPYVNVYLTDIGFSGTLIGTLGSAGAVLSLALTPLLNQIADRRNLHRRLFMLYLGGFGIANVIFATSSIVPLVIFAVILFRVTTSPGLTLGMQLTISLLVSRGKAILGQIRSFASLGFALASLLAGQLFALGGYPLLFMVGAAFAVASIQMATVFPARSKQKHSPADIKRHPRNRGFFVLAGQPVFCVDGHLQRLRLHVHPFQPEFGCAVGGHRDMGGDIGRDRSALHDADGQGAAANAHPRGLYRQPAGHRLVHAGAGICAEPAPGWRFCWSSAA